MNVNVGEFVYVAGLPLTRVTVFMADALRDNTFGVGAEVVAFNDWDDAVQLRWSFDVQDRLEAHGLRPDLCNNLWFPQESIITNRYIAAELRAMARAGKLPRQGVSPHEIAEAIASIRATAQKRGEGN